MTRETLTMSVILFMALFTGMIDYQTKDTVNVMVVVLFCCSMLYFGFLIHTKGFNMFGWRKKQIAEQVNNDIGNLPDPEVTLPMPAVAPPVSTFDNTDASYTVGKNSAGNTQLRLKLDYGSATITMAPDAVVEMIEQLAVTIRKEYIVDVIPREEVDG